MVFDLRSHTSSKHGKSLKKNELLALKGQQLYNLHAPRIVNYMSKIFFISRGVHDKLYINHFLCVTQILYFISHLPGENCIGTKALKH